MFPLTGACTCGDGRGAFGTAPCVPQMLRMTSSSSKVRPGSFCLASSTPNHATADVSSAHVFVCADMQCASSRSSARTVMSFSA
eukprot:5072969-Prymnesium_polylepis.4